MSGPISLTHHQGILDRAWFLLAFGVSAPLRTVALSFRVGGTILSPRIILVASWDEF